MLQELALRDPNKLGLWARNSNGFECLNREVWIKFKRDRGITKAKWVKLFQVLGKAWLNKKMASNHKYLEATPACDRLLRDWLKTELNKCVGQVVTRWVSHNFIKNRLVIPRQDASDVK